MGYRTRSYPAPRCLKGRGNVRRILLALLIVTTTLISAAPAQARNPECRFGLGRRAMRQTVVCVSNKFNDVSRSTALYVADRESNFQAHAYNSYSGASGIYQHLRVYWDGRYRAHTPPRWGRTPNNIFNGRTNIIVALTMVHKGGWGPWGQ